MQSISVRIIKMSKNNGVEKEDEVREEEMIKISVLTPFYRV